MSGRLCCDKQQQHSKLLAQFVFKVSAFCFNTRTKTRASLPDCRINNAPTQFVLSCQDKQTQFVNVPDPPFSSIACSIISCLLVGIFMPKNSLVTKFCDLVLGGPVIMPHHVHVTCDTEIYCIDKTVLNEKHNKCEAYDRLQDN